MALRLAASLAAVNSYTALRTNLCQATHQIRYQTVALEALSGGGFRREGMLAHDGRRPCPWFEAVYKHSRFGQLLRPAVPRDLFRSEIEGRPKWRACDIDFAFQGW